MNSGYHIGQHWYVYLNMEDYKFNINIDCKNILFMLVKKECLETLGTKHLVALLIRVFVCSTEEWSCHSVTWPEGNT